LWTRGNPSGSAKKKETPWKAFPNYGGRGRGESTPRQKRVPDGMSWRGGRIVGRLPEKMWENVLGKNDRGRSSPPQSQSHVACDRRGKVARVREIKKKWRLKDTFINRKSSTQGEGGEVKGLDFSLRKDLELKNIGRGPGRPCTI